MTVRMRFAAQALEELRKEDPQTPVSLHYIRSLAASGKVPVVRVGRRRLINYDALLQYLENPGAEEDPEYGKIRRISG